MIAACVDPGDYSVVIPCRDAAAWIAECIASCLRQVPPPREIILVDDGSTDGSAAAAAAVERPESVELCVLREGGVGSARARARGASEAHGDWLLFLDADDELEPDSVSALLAQTGESDVVYGDAVMTDGAGSATARRSMNPAVAHPIAGVLFNSPLCGTALVRRSCDLPWDDRFDAVDEFYYFANLVVSGRRFRHVPRTILRYRQHATPSRKSNRGLDYGTSLANAFSVLWETCRVHGRDDEELRAYMAWIMADLSYRAGSPAARSSASTFARALRPYRWQKLGFAVRHYGVKRVGRILLAWPSR